MGILDWLKGERKKSTASDGQAAALALLNDLLGKKGAPPRRETRELLLAFGTMPELQASIRLRAEAFSRVEWVVYRATATTAPMRALPGLRSGPEVRRQHVREYLKKGDLEIVDDHPVLDLLEKPNPEMSGRTLAVLFSKYMDLVGEGFFLVDRFTGVDVPKYLWPVPSHWCTSTPRDTADPYFEFSFEAFQKRVRAGDVWWPREVDVFDHFNRGLGLAKALGDELEMSEYATIMGKARMFNRGEPTALVSVKGISSDDEMERFQESWKGAHQGLYRNGRTAFTTGDIDVQLLSHTLVENDWVNVKLALRDLIISHFNVPRELLGLTDSGTRAASENAYYRLAKTCTEPKAEFFKSEFNAFVMPSYGGEFVLDYVSPVPGDREHAHRVMVSKPEAFTVDEWREAAGLEPLDGVVGASFLVGRGGQSLIPSLLDVNALESSPFAGDGRPMLGAPVDDGDILDAVVVEKPGDAAKPDAIEASSSNVEVANTALNGAQVSSLVDIATKVSLGELAPESAAQIVMAAFPLIGPEQAKAIVGAPRPQLPASTETPVVVDEVHAVDVDDLVRSFTGARAMTWAELSKVIESLTADELDQYMSDVASGAMVDFGDETAKAVGGYFAAEDPRVSIVLGTSGERANMINDVTRRRVLKVLAESVSANDDAIKRSRKVKDIFEQFRVRRANGIAETETQFYRTKAARIAAEQNGIEQMEWISMRDGKVRDAHRSLDGQLRLPGELYRVPRGEWYGAEAEGPALFGIAALDCNCRCRLAPFAANRTDAERLEVWTRGDLLLQKHEARMRDAVVRAFKEQEAALLEAMARVDR